MTQMQSVPDTHPYAQAMAMADVELQMGHAAVERANAGMARVCGRRAVGAFIQSIAPHAGLDYGTHAMANLRGIQSDESLPHEIRDAAGRLLGGARSIANDLPHSTDPLSDACAIINYFVVISQ